MDYRYVPELPVPIINSALAFARKKFKLARDLDRELLTRLYRQMQWRKEALIRAKKKDRTLKVSTTFYAVRDWVLDQRFPLRDPEDQFIRRAYSSALGKIGSEFRKRNEPSFQLKRTEHDRIMDMVTLDKDRRQYRLIV